ncbi:MAG: hypothetical protein GEV03_27725 [Streptosporangiales bacterium]|nr:hypothetical protein [Streptosporangiales bacterium]
MVLSPLGAYQVFGVPLDRLTGRLVDLRDVLGETPGGWANGSGTCRPGRSASTCSTGSCWPASTPPGRVPRTAGAVPIGTICREIGWSHKHLITRFRQQVGVTPKRAARVSRFEQRRSRSERSR